MINFIRGRFWYQLFIASIFCNFFYPLSENMIDSYHIIIYIVVYLCCFFIFMRKQIWKLLGFILWFWVNIIWNSRFFISLWDICAGSSFVVTFSIIPLNMRSKVPGMYLVTSASYPPLLISFLIFCTFSWALLKFEAVLYIALEFPMLWSRVTVFLRWILLSIILVVV